MSNGTQCSGIHAAVPVDLRHRDSNEFRPGWALHVFPVAWLGVGTAFCLTMGLRSLLPCMLGAALFLFCSRSLIAQNVRQIRRMGWFAPICVRWWIEVAALDWTLCMAGACFWLANVLQGGAPFWGDAGPTPSDSQ